MQINVLRLSYCDSVSKIIYVINENKLTSLIKSLHKQQWHNPGNVPSPSKPEDSIFFKINKSYEMKVNRTILSMYQN